MDIKVNNLGAIKEAEINLNKRITVLCGGNNTGKTYLSYLVYSLCNSSNNIVPSSDSDIFEVEQLIKNETVEYELDAKKIFDYKNEITKNIKLSLDSIFGLSDEEAEKLFKEFDLGFLLSQEQCEEKIFSMSYSNKVKLENLMFSLRKESGSKIVKIIPDPKNNYNAESFIYRILQPVIMSFIFNRTALYPILKSVIFPVERNSIYTFNKELSLSRSALIEHMQKVSRGEKISPFDLIEQGSKRYPESISDGLRVANDLNNIKKTKGDFYAIAQEVEKLLLDGVVDVSKEGDVIFTPNKIASKRNGKLPIHMTASIVKTLSSLVFYLKYKAQKDELIIIDEPEMNLHPDSQLSFVKILSKLVKNGLRLLVSTHSDYIVREINNYIMTDSLLSKNKKVSEDLNWNLENRISHDDVGVYFFNFVGKRKKITVKKIDVTEDGFKIPSMDEVIEHQNDVAEELFCMLNFTEDDND